MVLMTRIVNVVVLNVIIDINNFEIKLQINLNDITNIISNQIKLVVVSFVVVLVYMLKINSNISIWDSVVLIRVVKIKNIFGFIWVITEKQT